MAEGKRVGHIRFYEQPVCRKGLGPGQLSRAMGAKTVCGGVATVWDLTRMEATRLVNGLEDDQFSVCPRCWAILKAGG